MKPPQWRKDILVAIGLFFLIFFNYGRSLQNGFLVDDFIFLANKDQYLYQTLADYFSFTQDQHYYPIYYLVNVNLFRFFYDDLFFLRIFCLMIFYFLSILIYRLILVLTSKQNLAFLTAVLFSIHPINAHNINIISSNYVSIFMIFMILALLYYWRFIENKKNKILNYTLSLLFFLASLLSFEGALFFPVYLAVSLFYLKKYSFKQSLKNSIIFFVISVFYFLLWLTTAYNNTGLIEKIKLLNLNLTNYLAGIFSLLMWYVGNLFYPQNIVLIYNTLPQQNFTWLKAFMLLITVIAFLFFIFNHHKRDLYRYSLVWFGVGLVLFLVASFGHAYMGLVIEPHWIAFSSIGLFLLAAKLLLNLQKLVNPKLWSTFLFCLLLFFFSHTQRYNTISRDVESYNNFWHNVCPNNPIPLVSLAQRYGNAGDFPKAIHMYQKIHSIIKISPIYDIRLIVYDSMAIVYINLGEYRKAEELLNKSIELDRNSSDSYGILGSLNLLEGQYVQAEKNLKQALSIAPYDADAAFRLFDLYMQQNRIDEAIEVLQKLLKEHPTNFQKIIAQSKLAVAFYKKGNLQESYQLISTILKKYAPQGCTPLSQEFKKERLHLIARDILNVCLNLFPNDKEIIRLLQSYPLDKEIQFPK